MNRHIRSKHPTIYNDEMERPSDSESEVETEEIRASDKDTDNEIKNPKKRSWVWKFFDRLDPTRVLCNICNVVLSIKRNNSHNMNRHIRSKHPTIYNDEMERPSDSESEVETEEIRASDKDTDNEIKRDDTTGPKTARRSWAWFYFKDVSDTRAKCKLCKRTISHGGYQVSNMRRHIKNLHKDVYSSVEPNSKKVEDKQELPEWVSIYFKKEDDNAYQCNLCESLVNTTEKSMELLDHIKASHTEIVDLHKNPDQTVGFRIEYLQLNELNEGDGEPKTQVREEVVSEKASENVNTVTDSDSLNEFVVIPKKRKPSKKVTRKYSWIWKYFDKVSTKIFRCNICSVLLSIKWGNTTNLKRHVRTKHPFTYKVEVKQLDSGSEMETEENRASDKDNDGESRKRKGPRRRSWVWTYFKGVSSTQAKCTLCNRCIWHGGGKHTGNMSRHIRMLHKDVYSTVEADRKKAEEETMSDSGNEAETEISASDKDDDGILADESKQYKTSRRSWVWSYFKKVTDTQAKCKLCSRSISHGGKNTGNMSRHIKMVHEEVYSTANPEANKVADENSWVWKIFDSDEDDFYSCNICQFKCIKYSSIDKSVNCILEHIKEDHGIMSGDQIVTSVEGDPEPDPESN